MNKYQSFGGNSQEKGSNVNAAPASHIGEPFHNPYTFIPFPKNVDRFMPTALSADEDPEQQFRRSGVLVLKVKTVSPLLSCESKPYKNQNEHNYYKALKVGNDVVVPATGIRGSLRTLMTIISGGTLGYLDENLWLTQGRDARLGPSNKMADIPSHAFLGEVVEPGNATKPGKIKLGKTKLAGVDLLRIQLGELDHHRPPTGKNSLTYTDEDGTWKVKLSGRPVNRKGKKEGLFQADGSEPIVLPEQFWKDYQGRNRHSIRSELRKGDLVWLEPHDIECTKISTADDIESIQWARWGRKGKALKNMVPPCVLPDSMRKDGAVDMVTELFGQIPHNTCKKAAGPFAAKIRPGNLVFENEAEHLESVTLAPLSAPHPGCLAFYRDAEDLDTLNQHTPLKGYKVYRNTVERGENAPWRYSVQGVYGERGALKKPHQQKVNKTAELLDEGRTGTLKIAFRSLGDDDFALLLAACSVDWKLGGGKPLGLGHCRVIDVKLIDEYGNESPPMLKADEYGNLQVPKEDLRLIEHFADRINLYRESQKPVQKLRYPRAVTINNNKSTRAGLSWFARHAAPKKTGAGLETIWTQGALRSKCGKTQIKAQVLPPLTSGEPNADLLYGYDVVELDVKKDGRPVRNLVGKMEKFDPAVHARADEKAGKNRSQNSDSRQQNRDQR